MVSTLKTNDIFGTLPMNRTTFCLAALFFWTSITGCVKVGPDYLQPVASAPVAWQAPIDSGLNTGHLDPQALAAWWTILKDPLLTSYIHQAIAGNLDLDQARARLLEARAKHDMSSAGLFPNLDAKGSVNKSRSSNDRGGSQSTSYSSGFDAGWELDLFGGRQRSVEAAQAQLQASEEDLHDVLVSLLAEVALNYIEVRNYQTRLQIAGINLAAQEETLTLAEARQQSGLISELTQQQARYLVAGTRAQIPSLHTGLAKAKNALALLLGLPPGSLTDQLQDQAPLPALPPSLAVGIPADTLQSRPDIRKAERLLAAQTAQIGVATAELYPSLKLSGSIGLDALSAGKLFNSGSGSSSFGPSVSWTLFDGGAIAANIRLQSALQQESLAKYRATVLSALEEVEGALIAYAQEQDRHKSLEEAANAAEQASTLAELQYQSGLVNFTEVLDSRRSLLSFQDQLAESSATMIGNLIRLYKALGGGWTSSLPETNTLSWKQQ
jgi:NodT family efflux transporter outer membrane factor (OMF) lipoprotein